MELDGIKLVSGNKEILDNAIRTSSHVALEEQEHSTSDYIKELMESDLMEQQEVQIEVMDLLKELIDKMQKLNIKGNEFVIFFNDVFRRFGIMNENLECSFIGEVINENDGKKYKRKIWLKEKQLDESGNHKMYLLDTESLNISNITELEMREKLKNGQIVYESIEHQMKEFELEEK